MTIEQIERAYRSGRISRRSTVRGLVALGVSLPVAMELVKRWSMTETASPVYAQSVRTRAVATGEERKELQ